MQQRSANHRSGVPKGTTDPSRQAANESELVRAAQQGCTDSFAELVRQNSPRLLRFLYRRTGCMADAEDLTQEAFIRAYRNLDRYNHLSRFSTWLFTIASRLAISHLRARRFTLALQTDPTACERPGPQQALEERERSERLWSLVRQLPRNQRRALELHYAADLPIKQIAQVMGKSQGHVKVLLFRGRIKLAKKLHCAPVIRQSPSAVRTGRLVRESVGA